MNGKGTIELNEIHIIDFPIENEQIADSNKSTKDKLNNPSGKIRTISSPNYKKEKENYFLSEKIFLKKPEKNSKNKINSVDDIEENVFAKNIVKNEDVYLETSSHNPFTMSINSNNINLIKSNFNNNDKFNKFMRAKKVEIEKNDFISENDFTMNSTNELILLELIDDQFLEEQSKNKNANLNIGKGIEVILTIKNQSIAAFNKNTDFSVVSGEYFPIMFLNFNSVSAALFINQEKLRCKICVLGSKKAFLFEIPNKTFFEYFTNVLNNIIKNSFGNKTNLHSITLRKDYYKVVIKTFLFNKILRKIFSYNKINFKKQTLFVVLYY
jgi:hypothetical protein